MKTIDPRLVSFSSSLFLFFSLEGFVDSLIEGSVIEWPLRCETKSNRFRSEAEKRETSLALVQRHWLENCFRRPRVAPLYNFYGVPVYFRRYTTPRGCHKGFLVSCDFLRRCDSRTGSRNAFTVRKRFTYLENDSQTRIF